MKTWHAETLIVACLLGDATILLTEGRLIDWLSSLAVLVSFGYVSVASRLEESQRRTQSGHVDCYRWLTRYLVAKESLWVLIFLLSGLYPPLIGTGIFLLHPLWRRWYRSRRARISQ